MYETYRGKDGRVFNIYCISRYAQIRMENNGWRLHIPQVVKKDGWEYAQTETAQEMYDRLSQTYSKVKVYYSGTMVRGIRAYYAYCKR